jgi:integrase
MLHIKKVSREMNKAGKAPRSIEYAFACIRMVINHAIHAGYHPGPNPVTTLPRGSRPKYDNKRVRFMSRDEAKRLLDSLRPKSTEVHNMTLLSIYCGLRAGEIFSLTWGDVDLVHGFVTMRDTKSGKTRTLHMSTSVKEMFAGMRPGRKSDLVFPGKNGKQRRQMSKTFDRTIKELGFNDGIADRRQKITFHTCRHTCASWLVQAGISLYTVKKIMGHSTITLTERYSHLAPSAFRQAAEAIERGAGAARESQISKVVNITNTLE